MTDIGTNLGIYTLTFTLLMDTFSIPQIKQLTTTHDGIPLYCIALIRNIMNNLVLGPISWKFAIHMCNNSYHMSILEVLKLIIIHSFGYYYAHMLLHTKLLYRFHKLHHRFNKIIIPIAANCVTVIEYIFAYILPFIMGVFLVVPSFISLYYAVLCISFSNILIHTPVFENISKRVPTFLVSTHSHMVHHRQLNIYFSAPIFNVDNVMKFSSFITRRPKTLTD